MARGIAKTAPTQFSEYQPVDGTCAVAHGDFGMSRRQLSCETTPTLKNIAWRWRICDATSHSCVDCERRSAKSLLALLSVTRQRWLINDCCLDHAAELIAQHDAVAIANLDHVDCDQLFLWIDPK